MLIIENELEITSQIGTILSKSGGTRIVYNHKTDPELVIKVARFDAPFTNIIEYGVYEDCPYNFAKWLATPRGISRDGKYMLMERTYPIQPEDLPKEIPFFISDFHLANWGTNHNGIVCHDYGRVQLSVKMKEVDPDLQGCSKLYFKEYYEGHGAVKDQYHFDESPAF